MPTHSKDEIGQIRICTGFYAHLRHVGHDPDESTCGFLGESPDRAQLGHQSASAQPLEGLDVSEAWIHNVPWVLNLDNLNKIAS